MISELIRHFKERNAKKKHQSETKDNRRNVDNKGFNEDSILMKENMQYVAISEFSSATPFYSDILYKIMSKLRVPSISNAGVLEHPAES